MRWGPAGILLLVSLLMTACAGRVPVSRTGEATMEVPPPPPVSVPASEERKSERTPSQTVPVPPAIRNLAAQAEQASKAGDHDAAAAYLERALRIAPNHPALWQNLAVVRYRQGDYERVEGLAHKSNALAATKPALRAENWRLIAEVRRQRGDRKGADAAMAEVRRLVAAGGAN